jgi:uncharacterized FAD-dependent dehydrogenase
MLIKNIRILSTIEDIENDSIDVCVDSEDGYTYTVSLCTPKYFLQQMDQETNNFFQPGQMEIIVRKLTKEIITEAIEAYAENNAFWLKLHHFGIEIDSSVFDELQAKHEKELIEYDLLDGLEDLENEINKFDNLTNAEKSNLTTRIEKLAQLLDS